MRREIAQATHILIVCTETHLRRVDLHEEPGRGLGATWEGNLVILATYAGQGLNEKFIPIVFSPADQAFVPDFLQGVTRYNVRMERGYEQLYARITGQQLVDVPIGPRRVVGVAAVPIPQSAATPSGQLERTRASAAAPSADLDLVLIETKDTRLLVPAMSIRDQGQRVEFTLVPRSPDDAAFLIGLRSGWSPAWVWVAYGASAYEGSVEVADRSRDASGERWSVTIAVEERSRGYISEVTTSGKSVDEIAELRARRILLNEKPPAEVARWGNIDSTLEMLIQGMGSPRPLTDSPIPALYREFGDNVPLFLAAARLVAVLELQRTGTVEHVLDLAFALEALGRFRGRRRKVYTNRPAHEMAFEGVCLLD